MGKFFVNDDIPLFTTNNWTLKFYDFPTIYYMPGMFSKFITEAFSPMPFVRDFRSRYDGKFLVWKYAEAPLWVPLTYMKQEWFEILAHENIFFFPMKT